MEEKPSRNRDIRNLLFVLGAAVMSAGLLACAFIYFYGPSGRYIAGQTILDPATIQEINAQESQGRGSQKLHFVFDHFEFSYFDSLAKQRRTMPVSMQTYQSFYRLLSSLLSIDEKEGEIAKQFLRSQPTLLTASMRRMNVLPQAGTKIFQVIEFIDSDYFRVQLHDKQEHGEWVYYYKAHSYRDIMKLFTQTADL